MASSFNSMACVDFFLRASSGRPASRSVSGAVIFAKFRMNRRYTLAPPRNDLSAVTVVGGLAFLIEAVLLASISSFPGLIICPRYSMLSEKNRHLLKLSQTPASPSVWSISSTLAMCCSSVSENITTSSIYTKQVFHLYLERITSSAL